MRISITFRAIDQGVERLATEFTKLKFKAGTFDWQLPTYTNKFISEKCRWKLNKQIFEYIRHFGEEVFCKKLSRDVFADEDNYQIFPYGSTNNFREDFLYINGDWVFYDEIIEICRREKLIVLVVAPLWERRWMAILQEHTTHKYVFPRQPGVFLPKSTSYLDKLGACPWETAAFVADFRWKRCTERKIFSQEVPDIKACARILESLPRRTFLPPYKGKFTPDLPPQALNIERFFSRANFTFGPRRGFD